jgi:hypothetical protein
LSSVFIEKKYLPQTKSIFVNFDRMEEGNLESQKEFLEKIGSNFILKERRLNFPTEGTFRPFLKGAPFLNWRCSCDEVRSFYRQSFIL